MRESLKISYIAIFSGLALATSLSGISHVLVYPPVPYLKFDPAEIFDMIAYLLGGPLIGVITATIHFLGLTALSGDIIGPGMKFIAVLSMIGGYHLGRLLSGNYLVKIGLSTLTRIIVMTILNTIVLLAVAPSFLEIFKVYNKLFLIDLSGYDLLIIALILTGVYNLIHNFISVSLADSVTSYVFKGFKAQLRS